MFIKNDIKSLIICGIVGVGIIAILAGRANTEKPKPKLISPQELQQQLKDIIESYILKREQLTNLFVLIDIRHEPQKNDMDFVRWLGENGIPFAMIFTKADKLNITKTRENVNNYMNILHEEWEELPPYFVSSSEKQTGKEEILNYIEKINKSLTK